MTELIPNSTSKTLANRLAEGRIPITEALRYAMILAEMLRKLHDEGRAYRAVAPGNVMLTASGLELQEPPIESGLGAYAAPEVLAGQPADARSDIFSFGAVVYEMLTGRAAYLDSERSAPMPTGSPTVDRLVASCLAADPSARCQRMQKVMLDLKLLSAAAARTGTPAPRRDSGNAEAIRAEIGLIDARINARLQAQEKKSAELLQMLTEALARIPEEREDVNGAMAQLEAKIAARIQALDTRLAEALARVPEETEDHGTAMLQMETRFVARLHAVEKKVGDVQRAATEALYREPAEPGISASELEQVESRVAARLQRNEQAMAEMQRVAGEAVNTLREQLSTVGTQLAAAHERAARAEESIEASGNRVVERVQRSIDAVSERIGHMEQRIAELEQREPGADADNSRMEAVEQGLEALRKQTTELHDLVAEDMLSFENSLKNQAVAIESARTAMSQTDDLLERVVEALESLQNTVLDHPEGTVAVN